MSFNEVMDLDCYSFKKLAVDAFIDLASKTEEGRDYLEQCWILKQTSPDRNKLRNRFKE